MTTLPIKSWSWKEPYWRLHEKCSASPFPGADMYARNQRIGCTRSKYDMYAGTWAARMIELRDSIAARLGCETRIMSSGDGYVCAVQASDGRWLPLYWDELEREYILDEHPAKIGQLLSDETLAARLAHESRPVLWLEFGDRVECDAGRGKVVGILDWSASGDADFHTITVDLDDGTRVSRPRNQLRLEDTASKPTKE